MSIADARVHIDEALRLLTLDAYKGREPERMERADDFTIAEELERVDRAIGQPGKSMFAALADDVRSAYVEIKAARQALGNSGA